ncbi:MAG: hypothetical protein WCI88_01795 [Chloroflexota bacterium]
MSETTTSVWVLSAQGVRMAFLDPIRWMSYALPLNDFGILSIEIPSSTFTNWKRDLRLVITRSAFGTQSIEGETVWLVRRIVKKLLTSGEQVTQITAYSAAELLRRRIVAYAAGSSKADKTDKADDMLKAIVRENMGNLATIVGRDWTSYMTVQANTAAGASVTKQFSRRVVLDVLQEIAQDTAQQGNPIYFDVIAPSETTLEFRTYATLRGMDHSFPHGIQPIVFSPKFGNLTDIRLSTDWADEITYVYALGQGVEDNRIVKVAGDSTRISASPFGRIERVRDARNLSNEDSVQSEADTYLETGKPKRTLSGIIMDTSSARYGLHWRLGDKVTAEFDNEQFDCIINQIQVRIEDGTETIEARLTSI